MDAKQLKTEAAILKARDKLKRGEKLTEKEWTLIAYASQACHCGRS